MNRTLLWVIPFVLALGIATAAEYSVVQGERLTLRTDAYSDDTLWQLSVDYRILGTSFNHRTQLSYPLYPWIDDSVVLDVAPGTYPLYRRVTANDQVSAQLRDTIKVLPRGSKVETPQTSSGSTKGGQAAKPNPAAAPVEQRITIPPIPDVEAGTTFLFPLTISGKGTYAISLPTLGIGTYEAPASVSVDGTKTVNILLHIAENANPGTYTFPLVVGDETIPLRVRVIQYRTQTTQTIPWWIPVALVLILAIVIFLLLALRTRGSQPPRYREPRDPPHTPPTKDEELITYY